MADFEHLRVSDGNGDAALMHVTSDRSVSDTTIEVDVITNVPQQFIGTYGTLLPSGFIDPTTKRDFFGHVSGEALEIDSFCAGSQDSGNIEGQVVVIKPNTTWADGVAEFIQNLTGHGVAMDVVAGALIVQQGLTVEGGEVNLPPGSIHYEALAGNIFKNLLQTYTPDVDSAQNATADGSPSTYINLGGLKMVFGRVFLHNITQSTGHVVGVTFPEDFFAQAPVVSLDVASVGAVAGQHVTGDGVTEDHFTFYFDSSANGAAMGVDFIAIGI